MCVGVRPVELRPVGDPDLYGAWAGDQRIGSVRLNVSGSVARITTELALVPMIEDDISALLVAAVRQSADRGATEIEFDDSSLVVRHDARRLGFGGGLRTPLRSRIDDIVTVPTSNFQPPATDRADRTAWLVATLQELGVAATAVRPARAVGRWLKGLRNGVGDTLEVSVSWAAGRTMVISVPDRSDLLPEPVALAADTAGAVLRRFPEQAVGVQFVSFDRGHYELMGSNTAGLAQGSDPSIHLNVGFVSLAVTLERMVGDPPRQPPTVAAVDRTVAHELWHRIEMVFETRAYRSSLEIRRQLGRELGVETLEHAIKGGSDRAPAEWQAAHERLARDVSLYATTNPREATAEMFEQWWSRRSAPSPVVARFGQLVDQYLPG